MALLRTCSLVIVVCSGAACSDGPPEDGDSSSGSSDASTGSSDASTSDASTSDASTGVATTGGASSSTTAPDLDCDFDEGPFAESSLQADIAYLASDELGGRAPGTPGDAATLAFIDARFRCLGLTTPEADDEYRQAFVTSDDRDTANVVGILPGSDLASEVVVIGAHHDHLGTKGNRIFNGANDNASGVAAVLAIARSLAERGVVPRRTIAFVTFGYEEHDGDCEGSHWFVDHPPSTIDIDRVAYMLDLDMLGTYPSDEALTAYGSLPDTPARDILETLLPDHGDLDVDLGLSPDEESSDFQAFCNLGIPFLYFETWDLDCYHEPCDDADAIDYPSLGDIARLSADVLVELANTEVDLVSLRGTLDSGCPEV